MNIDEILSYNLDRAGNGGKVSVSFKKTVNVRQYETEVVEASMEVAFDEADAPEDVEEKIAVASAKVEYACMVNLLAKGQVTQTQFNERRSQLEQSVTAISTKMSALREAREQREVALNTSSSDVGFGE